MLKINIENVTGVSWYSVPIGGYFRFYGATDNKVYFKIDSCVYDADYVCLNTGESGMVDSDDLFIVYNNIEITLRRGAHGTD